MDGHNSLEVGSPSEFTLELRDRMPLVVAEYESPRAEIIKRGEMRYQVLAITLILAGTILTVGLQANASPYVLFVFPILAWFLARMWTHNMRWTRRLSDHIRTTIDDKYHATSWESGIGNKPNTSKSA